MAACFSEGQQLVGESGQAYLVVSPMTRPAPDGAPANVWSAVDSSTKSSIFIVKQPATDDVARQGWPRFRSEMVMHELFKDNAHIRQQLDRILPRKDSADPPALVLEPTETTLWNARTARPMTGEEIRVLMRGVLMGLKDIHDKGLVYADLKPDNIFVNGWRETADETTKENTLNAMIGDLGIVMEPAIGKVQPLLYRSPEVHFKSLITPPADIWSWGMIYCHLLQAQVQHAAPGLYDSNSHDSAPTALEVEQAVRGAIYDDFDLEHAPFYADCVLPSGHLRAEKDGWKQRLRKAGVAESDVQFLTWVLDVDPRTRPTASDILDDPSFHAQDVASGKADIVSEEPTRSAGIYLPYPSASATPASTPADQPSEAPKLPTPQVGDVYMLPLHFNKSAESLHPCAAATPQYELGGTSPCPSPENASGAEAHALSGVNEEQVFVSPSTGAGTAPNAKDEASATCLSPWTAAPPLKRAHSSSTTQAGDQTPDVKRAAHADQYPSPAAPAPIEPDVFVNDAGEMRAALPLVSESEPVPNTRTGAAEKKGHVGLFNPGLVGMLKDG